MMKGKYFIQSFLFCFSKPKITIIHTMTLILDVIVLKYSKNTIQNKLINKLNLT